ncbi:hypothetical protein CUR178_02248 [Leishmania enriettii]|uniref:CRAL-TRIO domain-containing protein n=1 Tax=Leishmania enriettii TaxID=5663 RepID=A0A836GNE0_LEIEN|nr:hypothetical protein CUR178_02248 [Leishmania enriettii]
MMIDPQSPSVERADTSYKDSDLLSSTTDCVDLNEKEEHQVTGAIKALLRTLEGSMMSAGALTTPLGQTADGVMAVKYFADFSYGLTAGEARYVMYRYLKSSDMNIRKAVESMTRSAAWRKKQSINKVALFPCLIPMKGFEQRTVCDELRLPFISNVIPGKRYVDAEGRLPLEHELRGYYDAHLKKLYADDMRAEVTDEPSQLAFDHSGDLSPQPLLSVSQAAVSSTPAAGPANGKSTLEGDATAEADGGAESEKDSLSSSEQLRKSYESRAGGALWRSFLSFIPFSRLESTRCAPHVLAPRRPSLSTATSEARRHSRFHSILSVGSGSDRAKSSTDGDNSDTSETEGVVDFLSTAGAGVAVTATPNALYADSLNFHGILQPIAAVITKHVPFSFHYWDLGGHPIMYCRLGGLHSKNLMQELFALTPIDAEPRVLVLLFNTYVLLVLEQLIRYCNRRNRECPDVRHGLLLSPPCVSKRREASSPTRSAGTFRKRSNLGSFVIVVDCAGVKIRRYLYEPLLVLVRSIVRMNTHHYPELMHHVYVANCTTAVSWSYLMLRGVLSKATREKITFCSKSRTTAILCENISSALVPRELGGECQCPGGCIPSLAAELNDAPLTSVRRGRDDWRSSATTQCGDGDGDSDTEQVAQQFDADELVFHPLHCTAQRLVLRARESRKLSFATNAQSEIVWEFAVKHNRDVTFSAVFVSAANDGAMLMLVPRRRVQNEAGHYICPSIGTVIFEWSNKHSFFTRCRLNVKVYHEECAVTSV